MVQGGATWLRKPPRVAGKSECLTPMIHEFTQTFRAADGLSPSLMRDHVGTKSMTKIITPHPNYSEV